MLKLIVNAMTVLSMVTLINQADAAPREFCMSEALFFEARGESIMGQRNVFRVIMNRVKDRRWPNTVCGVVHQKDQFSYTRLTMDELNSMVSKELHTFALINQRVIEWFNEGVPTIDVNMNHYTRNEISRSWMKAMVKIETVGDHKFFTYK